MARWKSSAKNSPSEIASSNWETFVHSNVQVVFFFDCLNILFISNIVISLMHYICPFWSNYIIFTIRKLFSHFCDAQLSIINSKPLEGGWRKRYHDPYSMLLDKPRWWGTGIISIPKHWSYKEDNPSSTPSSQRSRSFSFRKLKPLIITWGRVVSQLIRMRFKSQTLSS